LERKPGAGAFFAGMGIGTLGGLIGLGGAEFRLPLLIGLFRFAALEAVIVNKAMSLIVVASALPLRTGTISVAAVVLSATLVVFLSPGRSFAQSPSGAAHSLPLMPQSSSPPVILAACTFQQTQNARTYCAGRCCPTSECPPRAQFDRCLAECVKGYQC